MRSGSDRDGEPWWMILTPRSRHHGDGAPLGSNKNFEDGTFEPDTGAACGVEITKEPKATVPQPPRMFTERESREVPVPQHSQPQNIFSPPQFQPCPAAGSG
jgi:hypothetical protein